MPWSVVERFTPRRIKYRVRCLEEGCWHASKPAPFTALPMAQQYAEGHADAAQHVAVVEREDA